MTIFGGLRLRGSGRGLALFHTLALISLVLLVAFAIATSTLAQLNLSARYAQRTQCDYTAKAAMAEFILRAQQAPPPADITSVPPPLFDLYKEGEILLHPRPPLEGTARLMLSRCVDNSSNPEPVASWFDGAGKSSVPPFSVSVVYEITLGSRRYLYESLVQQRWPYALAAPGPIFAVGRIGPDPEESAPVSAVPNLFWSAPSEIKGRVLAMQTEVNSTSGPLVPHVRPPRAPINVSEETYKSLYPYASAGGVANRIPASGDSIPMILTMADRFTLGGPLLIQSLTLQTYGASEPYQSSLAAVPYQQFTTKGKVEGAIDLLENQPEPAPVDSEAVPPSVKIHDLNTHSGQVRYDRRLGGGPSNTLSARQRVRTLFRKPDTSNYQSLSINAAPLDTIVVTSRPGATGRDVYYARSGRCRCNGPLKPKKTPYQYDIATGTTIQFEGDPLALGALKLEDVSLAVDGDLTLEQYLLKGSNATLIVDGTLTLDGGYLDAGQNGMVIFCRRLVMKAQGQINGLIVAEKGAVLYGAANPATPPQDPGLIIKGGLLIGGNDLRIQPPAVALPPDTQSPSNVLLPLDIHAFMVVSTRIEYAPKYLRGLNRCGPYEVVATELRQ
ncbi:hypothetical protein IV102_36755 [bacterium]|nr:hypothetical protein [bacterium]